MSDITTLNGYKIKDEKAVRSYGTIAQMKADTKLKEGYHVKTKGYYEANDGGHGEYVIVDDETLVEDGGSIHVLTNGLRAKLISDSTVNIKQYGAHGDGLTDDTEAFSKAIAKYNQIYIPSGQYLITEEISLNKSVTLYGDGSDSGRSTYQYKSEILSENDYAFACEWGKSCIFRDLAFNGYGLNMPIGIVERCSFTGTLGIYYLRGRVDKCYFNADTGIQKAVDSVITNCTFAGCDIALDFTDSNDNRVVNNRIDWNELGLKMREAMFNIITNNIFDRQTTYAIDIDTSPYNIISNNNFERNLSAHIYGKMSYENITNNRFVMKRITDDSSSNELQPTTAFKVDSIGHTVFSSNYIYADKFFNARPLFSTMVFSGNSFNGNDMEEPLLDLGTITVANGQTGNFYALWDNVKYFNIYGSRIELTNIIITNDVNTTVYYSGDSHITRLDQVPANGIHVNILNDLGEQATYTIKARVKIREPWLMEMASE